ncbi:vitamin B12 dependent-methionine synthase activation domain-containing protein [Selenomonas flueggei]|uniref:Vitamin B12 dependent methionine synthase, activation domain protein n=1 Tax=Selenomonas flueggei ATCC 43531 TaxID=638302 RepID=C4V5G2_9FIRM|nr:vitamin B12 dependent-methionine synthase activation domain-containing protein [Selenomonas flueggei]EEQ47914.1 Vitamin B12 dependent methionine synthase, activation domain protein [Selenomonas flueggei ATCC 43531]
MFEPRFTTLNMNEILKYLGFRGQELTEEIAAQIRRCSDEVLAAATPRLTYRLAPLDNGAVLGVMFAGNDIPRMLEPCEEVVLFGATLGPGVERLMMRCEVVNAADSVIMDACASTAIENICNNFESDMRRAVEAEGRYLTDRFSPGYGDLPIAEQPKFFALLDMTRRIGVSLTPTTIMVPRKSVTAIMGIARTPQPHRPPDCEHCLMFRTCPFRKAGRRCREGAKTGK